MAEFACNNVKNVSNGHTLFELNCGYHLYMSYKENIDLCSKSKSAEELLDELQKHMLICRENLNYAQKLQKQAHNRSTKLRSYAPDDKV